MRRAALCFLLLSLFLSGTEADARKRYETIPFGKTISLEGQNSKFGESLVLTKESAPGDTTWVRVFDSGECSFAGLPEDGGQGFPAPDYATWCWEGGDLGGGLYDSCSSTLAYGGGLPGCFTHYDVYSSLTNQWHLDTYQAYQGSGVSPWCGEFGDPLLWNNPGGYGPIYNFSLILNLGQTGTTGFDATLGFDVRGVHMYDVERNYDYCYLEYAVANNETLATWFELARFHGTSNYASCIDGSGGPIPTYGCANYDSLNVSGPAVNNTATDLLLRWRFASDSAWDDHDAAGGVHTDGAWRIDNIWVDGLAGGSNDYFSQATPQTFGTTPGSGLPAGWSAPNFPSAQIGGFWSGGKWVNGTPASVDWWHIELDPSYANYGATPTYSNNWMWTADDAAFGQNQEDRYHYRLVSPVFDISESNPFWDPNNDGPGPDNRWSGVVVESDEYLCIKSEVGDLTDTQIRTFNGNTGRWSSFAGDAHTVNGGCNFWDVNRRVDWSAFVSHSADSLQFSWEFLDACDYNSSTELPCMGQHRKATYLIDNVSIGVFSKTGTNWSLPLAGKLQDTFARNVDLHSAFKENRELNPSDPWEGEDSLQIEVRDYDGLATVGIHWRISTDCGQNWDRDNGRPLGATNFPAVQYNSKLLNLAVPDDPIGCPGTPCENNGTYRTRIRISDNAGYFPPATTQWPEGSVIEYFFVAEDSAGNLDTFPNRLSESRTDPSLINTTYQWDRRAAWPFEVSVLPCPVSKRPLPFAAQNHTMLLVESYPHRVFDIEAAGLGGSEFARFPTTLQVYREALDRLGVVYDIYNDGGAGTTRQNRGLYSGPANGSGYGGILERDPGDNSIQGRRYQTVIWFFGAFSEYTLMDSAQIELVQYIDPGQANFPGGANLWLHGDDLCEDNELSDPAWVDPNGNQTTGNAFLWTNLMGLQPQAGGCPDDGGVLVPGTIPASGVPGTFLQDLQELVINLAVGTTGKTQDATPIQRTVDDVPPTGGAQTIVEGPGMESFAVEDETPHGPSKVPSSRVITFLAPLEMYTASQMRDCLMNKVLDRFGLGVPNPKPDVDCMLFVGVDDEVPAVRTLRLGPASPNPFNPIVRIPVDIPHAGPMRLAVYDVRGRLVRTLHDGPHEAGSFKTEERAFYWNGTTENGNDAASGVYFVRLVSGEERRMTKVVLLR